MHPEHGRSWRYGDRERRCTLPDGRTVNVDTLIRRIASERDRARDRAHEFFNAMSQIKEKAATLTNALYSSKKQNQDLRKQLDALHVEVLQYKQTISTFKQVSDFISDDEIRAQWGTLFYKVQGWVSKAFREVKGDIGSIEQYKLEWIEDIMPLRSRLEAHPYEINVFIAVIAIFIFDDFIEHDIFGTSQHEVLDHAQALANKIRCVSKPAVSKKWMISTHQLLSTTEHDSMAAYTLMKAGELADGVRDHLAESFNISYTRLDGNSLTRIFQEALDLIEKLHLHPAQIRLTIPGAFDADENRHATYLSSRMEDISGLDDDMLLNCKIVGSIFPMVSKVTDELGHEIPETVIAKAKVVAWAPVIEPKAWPFNKW